MKINGGNQRQVQTVKPSPQNDAALQPGSKVSGKITKVDGNTVTITNQGGERQLTNASEMRFHVGEHARFEVLANENGKVLVRPETQSEQASREAMVKLIGDKGLLTLDALKNLNIPMTQTNYDQLQKMGIEVKVLDQMLQNATDHTGEVLLNTDIESSIKSLILTLDQTENSSHPNGISDVIQRDRNVGYAKMLLSYTSTMLIENLSKELGSGTVQSLLKNETLFQYDLAGLKADYNIEENKLAEAFFNVVKSSDSDAQKMVLTMMKSLLGIDEQMSYNKAGDGLSTASEVVSEAAKQAPPEVLSDEKTLMTTAVKALLSQVTEAQKALFIKNDLALTLKNLFVSTLQDSGFKSISDSFALLSKHIGQLPIENQQALLTAIGEAGTDQLSQLLHFIQTSTMDEAVKNDFMQEVGFIKDALEISTQFGDRIMVLEMPVTLEERETHVSMYVKKRSVDEENDDLTVLVALKTHQLGEVRCLVAKKGTRFDLHFKLETDEIRDAMAAEGDQLRQSLTQIGIKQFNVDFSTMTTKYPGIELEPAMNAYGFDLLV
ncbi:flagellar hook-length control protein FliK [Fusibacter paucivorans]|uniref:Flagellar hook-length control protein FliK n=1 Tax=Fusibacter paucivorans TaxID=76009 RepID=A0ABS5PSF8_9FIRM|nr:flagellar hook-length control protein FliK [Fusibacter paucivorans]MBS7527476.1 flagellar hook-length control protein FliK [Fusibacter paucivorans]